ncbi:MAG TPA: CBS domain-containing protein [Thermomicrobiaceae bacterium]|nr:CBS domain-containing protein [Thermomicrobiaceae bacterium]
MLSELLRYDLTDRGARHRSLVDLPIELDADHPAVTGLLWRHVRGTVRYLPWSDVVSVDPERRRLVVDALAEDEEDERTAAETDGQQVLLRRDILDALVIDLTELRAMRANDLALEVDDGELRLRAVDASGWAVLRRLSHGLVDRDDDDLRDWTCIEFLRGDPRAPASGAAYNRRIARLPPGEIALLMDALPYLEAAELVTLLPDPLAADTLEVMSSQRQLQVFEELDETVAARVLALMAPDAAADLIGHLEPTTAERYLGLLPPENRDRVVDLLRYPEDTVGGIMTNDVVIVPADATIREAVDIIRRQAVTPDLVYYVYVVDDLERGRLRGMITLRTLLLAEPDQRVDEVMNSHLITLQPLAPAREAAQHVVDNQLFALPVVGAGGRLVGAVTVDAAVLQVAPESWRQQVPRVFA